MERRIPRARASRTGSPRCPAVPGVSSGTRRRAVLATPQRHRATLPRHRATPPRGDTTAASGDTTAGRHHRGIGRHHRGDGASAL